MQKYDDTVRTVIGLLQYEQYRRIFACLNLTKACY